MAIKFGLSIIVSNIIPNTGARQAQNRLNQILNYEPGCKKKKANDQTRVPSGIRQLSHNNKKGNGNTKPFKTDLVAPPHTKESSKRTSYL